MIYWLGNLIMAIALLGISIGVLRDDGCVSPHFAWWVVFGIGVLVFIIPAIVKYLHTEKGESSVW